MLTLIIVVEILSAIATAAIPFAPIGAVFMPAAGAAAAAGVAEGAVAAGVVEGAAAGVAEGVAEEGIVASFEGSSFLSQASRLSTIEELNEAGMEAVDPWIAEVDESAIDLTKAQAEDLLAMDAEERAFAAGGHKYGMPEWPQGGKEGLIRHYQNWGSPDGQNLAIQNPAGELVDMMDVDLESELWQWDA